MTESVTAPGRGGPVTPGALLALVRSGRATSRSELRRLTGLSRTAVTSRVDALLAAGLVAPGGDLASTGGRPAGSLVFNAGAGAVLAAAIGRSRSQVAVFDLAGEELASSAVDHDVGAGPDEVMPVVADQFAHLLGPGTTPVLGVGISLPGTVDRELGISVDTPIMAGWDGVALPPYLEHVTRAPLYVANDADVLALSERAGHAASYADLIVVKASTGLGLGIQAGGRLVLGSLGAAGDIGHTEVPAAAGLPCRCGATGCLETVAAGWALVAAMREAGRPVEHVRDLVGLAQAGDAEAKRLLRESGRRLGEVLAVAINLLNPGAVVLGGDMAAAFDAYAAGVREQVYAHATALATRELQVLPSTYGDRAGLVGCATLALDHVLSPAAVDAHLRADRAWRAQVDFDAPSTLR